MNATQYCHGVIYANTLASVGTIVRQYFPESLVNFTPWQDDPDTRRWLQQDTIDLAFHFPGWSPRLQCRCLLIELRVANEQIETLPRLIGVLMRGLTFDGERWRFSTIGDWQPTGSHLPQQDQIIQLHSICRDLFVLFSANSCLEDVR